MAHDVIVPDETVRVVAEAAPDADRTGQFPWIGIRAVDQSGLL
ncbi:acyl-CoA dehydrogenase, partial [Rhizobium ruizarguesonis]